ncbi:hypothetical protein JTE90_007560 [Oedothorax gibbosus]|uniref:Uncharacterized protein n=1 Tax=Oedothorax gibbosus TaxID=931172 RepID=A0AAV6TQU1_9ARAC|nr:hypothetical protein JTE90_007560 [Oedothorax gibbosus]
MLPRQFWTRNFNWNTGSRRRLAGSHIDEISSRANQGPSVRKFCIRAAIHGSSIIWVHLSYRVDTSDGAANPKGGCVCAFTAFSLPTPLERLSAFPGLSQRGGSSSHNTRLALQKGPGPAPEILTPMGVDTRPAPNPLISNTSPQTKEES